MAVLPQVQFQRVAVLGGVGAVLAAVLVNIRVGLHVRVEHRLVDAAVVALGALEGLAAEVIAQVVNEVVLKLGHKVAPRTAEHLVCLDVRLRVLPVVVLLHGHVVALLATVLPVSGRIRAT